MCAFTFFCHVYVSLRGSDASSHSKCAFVGCRELVELVSMVLSLKMRVLAVCLFCCIDVFDSAWHLKLSLGGNSNLR